MGNRRQPWAELEARSHIRLGFEILGDLQGLYAHRDGRAAILLDCDLDDRQLEAVLAHELVHDERGGGCASKGMPPSWNAVVAREEHHVEREVADWLVPADELVDFIRRHATAEEIGVTVWEVAEHFEVPDYVAERALRELGRRNPEGWEHS